MIYHTDCPQLFQWNEQRYFVRKVVDHAVCGHDESTESWTVIALPDRAASSAIFTLYFDWRNGRWSINRVRSAHRNEWIGA